MAIILNNNIMFIQILHVENYGRLEWVIKGIIFNWTFCEMKKVAFFRYIPSHGIIFIPKIKICKNSGDFANITGVEGTPDIQILDFQKAPNVKIKIAWLKNS